MEQRVAELVTVRVKEVYRPWGAESNASSQILFRLLTIISILTGAKVSQMLTFLADELASYFVLEFL